MLSILCRQVYIYLSKMLQHSSVHKNGHSCMLRWLSFSVRGCIPHSPLKLPEGTDHLRFTKYCRHYPFHLKLHLSSLHKHKDFRRYVTEHIEMPCFLFSDPTTAEGVHIEEVKSFTVTQTKENQFSLKKMTQILALTPHMFS